MSSVSAVSRESSMPESARMVWRQAIVPQLSLAGLDALRLALRGDDPRLIQGATTAPPPLQCLLEQRCEGADSVGFAAWQGDGLQTVGQVEEFFARVCYEADRQLGEPTACRWFLNWFDDTPREQMRLALLAEVELALAAGGQDRPAA
jgi:hypothetical protein